MALTECKTAALMNYFSAAIVRLYKLNKLSKRVRLRILIMVLAIVSILLLSATVCITYVLVYFLMGLGRHEIMRQRISIMHVRNR